MSEGIPSVDGWPLRYRLLAAGVAGVVMPIVQGQVWAPGVQDKTPAMLVLLGLIFVVVLALICQPLTRYRVVLGVALVASVTFATTSFVRLYLADVGLVTEPVWIIPVTIVGSALMMFAATSGLLSLAVFLRKRNQPIYSPGHCANCGYNLTGLSDLRCPECGRSVGAASEGS